MRDLMHRTAAAVAAAAGTGVLATGILVAAGATGAAAATVPGIKAALPANAAMPRS